ncbi:hypothetical protein [Silvimonas sp.]|uniref:hypothetical protein n=1 Tax=Silvimonas sp. TaxID=2650811 RepID=UPI0028506CFE|nr:hypothetical protein [Silvimonas sp.]MDR3427909.1 hypothetical protein [Silvimonas sp.]
MKDFLMRCWRDIKGDLQRSGWLLAVVLLAAASLHFVSWHGLPGDMLSVVAFELVCVVLLAHVLRRIALPGFQLGAALRRAVEEGNIAAALASGAVLAFMAVLIWALVALLSPAQAAELPENAKRNLPVLLQEQAMFWPDVPYRSALAAQVEQETCTSLKSRQCWSEHAELKTSREYGVGLGQCTKTARFDCMAELKKRYAQQLVGWSWQNPYQASYQARALVLQDRALFTGVRGSANPYERTAMMLNGYNAGPGTLASRRAICAARAGCDPSRWFGHVETAVNHPQKVAQGYGQSFQQIATQYPRNVLEVRRPRYVFLDRG